MNNKKIFDNFKKILPNDKDIIYFSIIIYFLWVIYQIFMLTRVFTEDSKMGNLPFFSFTSSINDFLIILWKTIINLFYFFMFLFVFLLVINLIIFIFKVITKKDNKLFCINDNKYTIIYSLIISFFALFPFFFSAKLTINYISLTTIIIPYILCILFVWLLIKKKITKNILYVFIFLSLLPLFFTNLIWPLKYYWCKNLICNDIKDCVLLVYQNDKYWFTWNWDVYKLEEFKSFYTYHYFKDEIYDPSMCE